MDMSERRPILMVTNAGFGDTPVPPDALVQPGEKVTAARNDAPTTPVEITILARRIVRLGNDTWQNARRAIDRCCFCDFKSKEFSDWDDWAHTLILEPHVYKNGCVAIMSECPKCFESSCHHGCIAKRDGRTMIYQGTGRRRSRSATRN